MKYSINKTLLAYAICLTMAGCAGQAPKPVITKPAESVEEGARLEAASKAFSHALKQLNDKDYAKAKDILLSLAKQYPEYAGIYANLGIAYMNLDMDQEAQQSFDTALNKKPIFPSVYNQLGLLHRTKGRFKEAEAAYLKGIEVDPNFNKLYLNLGILYDLYLMDEEKALKNYLKYQELAKPADDEPVNKWIIDLTQRLNPVQ